MTGRMRGAVVAATIAASALALLAACGPRDPDFTFAALTPTASPTGTTTPVPSPGATAASSPLTQSTDTPTPTPSPGATETPAPTPEPAESATSTPSPEPTSTTEPTPTPTGTPAPEPTPEPPAAPTAAPTPTPTAQPTAAPTPQPTASGPVVWANFSGEWEVVSGTAPPCPAQPLVALPVNLAQATSTLYPGQYRGTDYKAHGGFRFDGLVDGVTAVKAPISGTLIRGARYIEGGDLQYLIDMIAPCGIMVRLDHLRSLQPAIAVLFASFPAPAVGDSRTQQFATPLAVSQGTLLATGIGNVVNANYFIDFGVYDLRQRNAASEDPAWLAGKSLELAGHAVCWFDWLPAYEEAAVRGLPATAGNAASDYCLKSP